MEKSNNKQYFVSYVLTSDEKNIIIVTFVAIPAFDEVGIYTEDEAKKVVELLQKQKVPKIVKTGYIGSYVYKTYEEWGKFVKSNDKKIKKLLKNV